MASSRGISESLIIFYGWAFLWVFAFLLDTFSEALSRTKGEEAIISLKAKDILSRIKERRTFNICLRP